MIAIDSNVVLRRLLQDDAAQCLRVDRLFAAHAAILITDIVLVEVAWTLAGKRYRARREQIVAAIGGLMEDRTSYSRTGRPCGQRCAITPRRSR
ncbi:MAG: hypothetical protein HYV17_16800 [Xanthomonadales bacterium]|nr:hypothetical protein [Xanthomonadales bacterium]